MPRAEPRAEPRHGVRGAVAHAAASLGIGALGTLGVVALSLGMNGQVEKKVLEPVTVVDTVMAAPKPVTDRRRGADRPAPTRKARRTAPSASPLLAAGLSGLSFGLADAADQALVDATAALVGDVGGSIVDEGEVERPPTPTLRTPPSFPARARSLGQSGSVTVSFVVDVDGSVADVYVVASEPPGVFDQAAVKAVEGWRFEPGTDHGNPVAVRVRQTLTFELE